MPHGTNIGVGVGFCPYPQFRKLHWGLLKFNHFMV
jgi:hypothetical protein